MAKVDFDIFEKIIVQNCLKKDSPFLSTIIDYLDSSIFKDRDIGSIIEIITKFYTERDSIPSLTEIAARLTTTDLKESFKKVAGYIKQLDSSYNEEELINNTEYFLKQRKFSLLIEKTIEKRASNKDFNLEEIHAENEKIQAISLIDNLGLDFLNDTGKVKEYLTKKDNILSTGYPALDEAFGGGMQAEGRAFYDIGGETNVGKSIFLANIAVNVLMQNKKVVIISPEMSEMRYAKRISGILTGIAINSLANDTDNFDRKIQEFKDRYTSQLIIKEVPTKGVSVKHIHGFLLRLKRRLGFVPDLICIDGHALLRAANSKISKHEELQQIVQECRGLSYIFPAPILSVAQLNRSSHKSNNPGLDSIAGSWDSIQDMDGHVNIWQTDEDRAQNIIRFGGKKSRDGAKGVESYLNIDYDTLKLIDPNVMDTDDVSDEVNNSLDDLLKFE